MKKNHNETRLESANRILSRIMRECSPSRLSSEMYHDLACMETSLRADIVSEWLRDYYGLWSCFRSDMGNIFLEETGVPLPLCCRFPRSDLYQMLRRRHTV